MIPPLPPQTGGGSGLWRDYSDDDEELLAVIGAWLQVTKGGRHEC